MRDDDKRHGTYAGHMAHASSGVPHCDPCKAARLRYNKRLRLDHQRGIRRSMPITGARRRLQALSALGHTQAAIAAALGVSTQRVHQWTSETKYAHIYTETHEQILALYDELSMTVPEGRMAQRNRNAAKRKGWVPPLAWDDIDNDVSPCFIPNEKKADNSIDEVAVRRFVDGDLAVTLNRAERQIALILWEKAGKSLNDLERRTGWNTARMRRQVAA